jgi:hypothetical protein
LLVAGCSAACGNGGDGRMVASPTHVTATPTPTAAPTVCSETFRSNPSAATPPYGGTLFIDPDIMTNADPTSFAGVTYQGQGERTMYDRRIESSITVNAHLFSARFGTNVVVEVQVNPEFSREDAEVEAVRYATTVGRMPAFLFRDVDTMWIHRGLNLFGGGGRSLLIHTDQGAQYVAEGLLEEVFLHEAAHASLDAYHATAPRWLEAQVADGGAISDYARDYPTREDVAETLAPYLAQRFWSERLTPVDVEKIRRAIPARLLYLDCLELSIAPP